MKGKGQAKVRDGNVVSRRPLLERFSQVPGKNIGTRRLAREDLSTWRSSTNAYCAVQKSTRYGTQRAGVKIEGRINNND